ncbi:hypothetical protein SKAU_G00032120 [Synaphobranchus kaupii]|uniref:C2H2-type domain-containing protein n=1 Tax=Synaphobranchus kaupii TaxID=118154 RepID=A0A9Q1GFA1_SYNKA|nr:hypothetical protein SKAU_G00032120 [Synaphobranchus kaupii]
MSEAILAFQAQLSGIMETVLKTAVFEITWLVESSFQGEVVRSRREAEVLRQRLRAAERRGRGTEGSAKVTCEECRRISTEGNERRTKGTQAGVQDGCGIKEEEDAGITPGNCLMDTSDEATPTSTGPPETTTYLEEDRFNRMQKEEELKEVRGHRCPQESQKVTVESSGCVYSEDTLSKDSAELLQEQGCVGDPGGLILREGPKLTGPALEYATYDGAAIVGGRERDGDVCGHGLSQTATGEEKIQIENVISLSRPQHCSANHVRRKISRKSRFVASKQQQQQLELAPVCQSAAVACSAIPEVDASALSFSAPKDMRTLQDVAPGDKQISCVYCGKSFSYISRLKIHLLKHTGEKPFSCSQCGKRFTIARNLERHQHIHWGEAAFCCSQCGKRFKRADHLKVHQRVHTGERPYSCTQCNKCFRFSGDLNTHKRVHTGEKPYCCTLCGNRFSQLRQLKAHQRNHKGLGWNVLS